MEQVVSARREAREDPVALCVHIARLGFGADVMRLALVRAGIAPEAARLIALSVAGSYAALRTIEAGAKRGEAARDAAVADREAHRRSRAASHFLRKILAFVWFGLIAVAGGLALGWVAGFEQGAADGYDRVERAIERLLWR